MALYTRQNAWINGGDFSNPDLLWYAKGVGIMQSRALDDQNSWWFFAAIHGQEIDLTTFPGWGHIPSPPQVPVTPLPTQQSQDLYWDQCQHQSWYFPPWHRGYLIALEAQIRTAVVGLGGPSNWALPYWNYFGPADEYRIPPAFTQATLPDGSANPLFVKARYGPNFDGNIYVTTDEDASCQTDTAYTDSYGGPETTPLFWHGGGSSGDLESNPHNGVHVDVGGFKSSHKYGVMSDPGTAGLDPIFYLHHCNIDRMWAAWNNNGNSNPTDPNWLGGPATSGERAFAMPMPDGSSWVYTPNDVKSLGQLDYTYDDLATGLPGVPATPSLTLAKRLMKLGAPHAPVDAAAGAHMNSGGNAELLGAHDGALNVTSSGARATVKLDSDVRKKVSNSLTAAAIAKPPDRVFLRLENVRGNIDATKLYVTVNQKQVGRVALFGLRRASSPDSEHGGEGLTFLLDITDVIDDLFLDGALHIDSLDVRVDPSHEVPDDERLTIGRVSVYRQAQQ